MEENKQTSQPNEQNAPDLEAQIEQDALVDEAMEEEACGGDCAGCAGCGGGADEELIQLPMSMLSGLIQQRDEYLDAAQRMKAEFENYKKRNATLRTDSLREGRAETIEKLLPVLDDLQRALAAQPESDKDSLTTGVEMVAKKMLAVLAAMDVTPIEAIGKPFDPQLHEAMLQQPVEDEAQKGIVITEMLPGYMIGDKVLRYAMVVVGS